MEMVHTPFTWRYGGHQVSICGSFNGWTEKIPMTLVEVSSSIFQIIIDLPPGYHQYKFFVDGMWRVDEQQICAQDEYGTINNIILVNGAEKVSPNLPAEAFGASINLDKARIMQFVGSSLGAPVNKPVLQFSDGEMDVSRNLLSMHLSSSRAYDLIPYSGKVIVFDVEVAVEQAFRDMFDQGLAVVPLWDEHHGQIAGMLTASDFMLILLKLHRNRAMFTNEELDIHTISAWKHQKFHHPKDMIGALVPLQQRSLIQAGPDESLGGLASRILHNNISAVPIIHSAKDGSCPQLLHIACLSEILKRCELIKLSVSPQTLHVFTCLHCFVFVFVFVFCIFFFFLFFVYISDVCRHFKHHIGYLPLLQQPIGYLPLGTWAREAGRASDRPLLTLRTNDSLDSALNLLLEAQISSVPILDDRGNIVSVYSRSDIMSLAKDNMYIRIQLDEMMMSQALEATGEAGGRYQTCTRFDSLCRVMELLSEPDVRRVIVIEACSRRIEGIITLRDVFTFILR
ncbi:sucrose nonfermenting 4-like protein isoform X2 [Olea europaea var. sylvestris]|uniref:sucrose nonfermenting 4-like protein isoform X2 n=1 Tax=Olea europaea var. sylvestris TaxID=158386 RepID=UPI000C1CFE67|nr:sucrose nonfermenting 4-like protein isoform X2 [Olea europaea var. sylvestris]